MEFEDGYIFVMFFGKEQSDYNTNNSHGTIFSRLIVTIYSTIKNNHIELLSRCGCGLMHAPM